MTLIKYNKPFVNYYNHNKRFKQQKIKPHVLLSLPKITQGFINNNRTINNDIKLIKDVDNTTYEIILKVNKKGQHINSVNNKLLLINSRMFSKRFDYNAIFGTKYKEVA